MGIGLPETVAELWQNSDPESYNDLFIGSEDGIYYFVELPDWAYDENDGPFYIDDDGQIFGISLRPSHKGELIGNLL